nr:MAG: NS3 [Canine parvovirus]
MQSPVRYNPYPPLKYKTYIWSLLCTEPHCKVEEIKSEDGWYSTRYQPFTLQKLCHKTIQVADLTSGWPKHTLTQLQLKK